MDTKQIEVQLKEILKAQRTMQDSINRLDRDLGEDRKDIGDLKIQMGKIDDQMEEVRGLFHKQTEKIKDTVKDSVADVEEKIDQIIEEGGK